MATRKKKKKAIVRLELSASGLLGLVVVCFCIFLWMFIFGVWTGQSILQSDSTRSINGDLATVATKLLGENTGGSAEKKTTATATVKKTGAEEKKEHSYFAVQVSAFRERARATKVVLQWRARHYESFFLLPDKPGSTFHRVFIGPFEKLAEANAMAAKVEKTEQKKVLISLIPADQLRYPVQ